MSRFEDLSSGEQAVWLEYKRERDALRNVLSSIVVGATGDIHTLRASDGLCSVCLYVQRTALSARAGTVRAAA